MPPTFTWASLATSPSRIAGICGVDLGGQQMRDPVERMPGHVQAQHLALQREFVLVVPLLVGHLDGEHRVGAGPPSSAPPNRSNWPIASAFLVPSTESTASVCTRNSPLRGCSSESNAPALISDSVTFLLQAADVDLVEVVGEVGELALVGAGIDQRGNDIGADVAHRAQPEADVGADRGEVQPGLVDVRRQHRDAQLAAVGQVDRGLVLVVADRGEQAGHVLGRDSWP